VPWGRHLGRGLGWAMGLRWVTDLCLDLRWAKQWGHGALISGKQAEVGFQIKEGESQQSGVVGSTLGDPLAISQLSVQLSKSCILLF